MAERPVGARLCAVIGPTAAGKGALARACARELGAWIVCVDSMKVYRGLDIATAKPDAQARACVPHHCLDLAEPTDEFSVARYVEAADAVINVAIAQGRPVVLVGGTALYYKALLQGLFPGPPADPGLRARLQARARAQGSESLHAELARIDRVAAARIHPRDLRRIVRALEVTRLTGKPISAWQEQWGKADAPGPRGGLPTSGLRYPCRMVMPAWERPRLHERIRARIERMLATGLELEARRVYERRRRLARTPLQAVGYKEWFRYFDGACTRAQALQEMERNTRRLAKSQDTWFRKFPAHSIRMHPARPRRETTQEALAWFTQTRDTD